MSDYVASITRGEETQYFETFADANTAAQAGDTIKLLVSELSVSDVKIINLKAGVTLEGVEGCTTIDGQQGGGSFKGNVVFKNIIFTNSTGNNALRNCYSSNGPVSFINCTFDANTYGCHFDQTKNDVSFTDCTFTGWNSFGSGDATITFTDCTFDKSSSYATVRPYVNTVMTGCVITEDFIEKGSGGVDSYGSSKSLQLNNCTIVDAEGNPSTTYTVEDSLRGSSDTNAFVIDGVQDEEGKFTAGKVIANNVSTAKNFVAADISFIPDTLGAISYDIESSTIEVKEELAADITLPEGTNLTLDNGVAEGVKIYLPYEPGSEEEANWIANNTSVPVEDIQAYVAMIGDKGYYSFADANAAAQSGDTIKLLVSDLGTVSIMGLKANVTLEGVEGCTTIHGSQKNTSFQSNVVIKNIIFSNPAGVGLYQSDCLYGPVSFENCTFDTLYYGVHFNYTANDISFTDCTFIGWNSFGGAYKGNIGTITFTGCFIDTGTDYAELRPYANTVMTDCTITEAFIEKDDDMGLENYGSNTSFQINNCKVVDAEGEISTKYTVEDALNEINKDTSVFVIDGVQDAEGKFTAGKVIANNVSTAKNFVADDISFIPDTLGAISYDIGSSTLEVKGELAANITLPEGTNLTLDNGVAEGVKIYLPYEPGSEEETAWLAANDTVPVEDIQAYVAMIGDKGYYSFADANAAAQAGDTIKLLVSELTKDEINVINLKAGVTLEGVEGCTTIKGQQGGASFKANIVIKNIIFSNPGGYGLRNCYSSNGPVSFENCTFDAWAYGVHFDGLKNDVSFTDCNFKGWNSFADNGGKLYFTNCTFDTGTDFAELRPYGNTVMTGCSITEAFVEKGKSGDMGLESTGSNRLFQIDDCTIIDADGNPSTKYAVDDAVNYVSSTSAFAIDAEQDAEGKFTSGTIIGGKLATVNGFVADEIKIDFLSDENYADTGSVNYTATASGKTLSLGGTVTKSVNVPADVVINEITLEDGAHLTLNSKDGLAAGSYTIGDDSIIFINDNMTAEEIAAWKTAHGIDESVELLSLAGGIGAPEADTVVPVSATEQNSYKSHIVNLGVDETLTEDLVAPAVAEIIGQETEGGVTTTFINPVGTIYLNNQGGAYAEVRGNVTQNSTAEAIVVNNVTAAANADDNGGFATVAGQMNITGNLTAAGQITVRNGENATMAMRDTVMEKEGYLLQAANVVIENDGDMVANISAVDTVAIHNTGILAGTVNGVEITIDCEGTFEDANITAADVNGNGELSITADQILVGTTTLTADSFWLDEEIVIVMDKDSVITYNVEFINDGTITVDMTGATEASYLIVANLSGDNVKVRDFDDVRLINGSGYMLTVLNRQNLIALKSDASQEVFKVSAAWKDYEVGQAIEGQDGFIYGFNAFSNLNDASRSLTADTTAIDAVNHTATEGLSERINVIDRTLTFSGSSDLPATGEIAISTDSESAASAIFAAGSDYSFSKVTFVDAAGKNSLFIGAADGDATTFGVGTIADTVGDTVKIVNATVTAGSYTVNGTDNTLSDVGMTAGNLTVAAGAVFGVSDSAVTATAAISNAGTIRLSDSIFSAAALENTGTIILNGINMINAALSGNGEIEINADAVIGEAENLSSITDTGSNSLIFKGIATIVGSITVGSDILLDRSGASTEVDVTGTLLTNGNFTLGGNDTFEDYLYVDGLGSTAGSLLGDLVISEDCEVSLSNGATLTYAGDFTNNGKISYAVKSPTLLTYTLIDYVGNGVKTIDDYDLSKITLSKSLKDYTVIVSDSDLVAAKIDTSAIHVDAAWAGSSKGDIVKDAQNNEYVYGYNAFAQLAEFIPTFNGGDIVAHEAGNVASTETTAGEGIEINNPGTYNLAGAEWTNVGYLQLNAAKAALSTHVVVNIDNANLVATKIQARRDADFVITDSHLDFENVTASRGYTCIYANSTLILNNSVYGYNHYSGNSSAIVAGRAGIVEGQIQPTDNYGKTAVQIDGKLIANNSTLFTVTGDDTVGFGVQDKGYVELTDSVLYAGAIAIGVNQTDAKKKSENTGVDVATMVLDNSVQIRQNADNYKIEVGKEVAGALIVRNNSLIDRADAPMTVSGGSSVDISSSTVKVSALTNNGTFDIANGAELSATTIANTGTINVIGNGNTVTATALSGAGSVTFKNAALDNKISLAGSQNVRFLGTTSIANPNLADLTGNFYVGTYGLDEAEDSELTINGDVTFGLTYVGADDEGASGKTAKLDIAAGKTLTVGSLYARKSSTITVNTGAKLLSGYGSLQGTINVDGGVVKFSSETVKHDMSITATNGGVIDLGYTEGQTDRRHTYSLTNGSILTVGILYNTDIAITMDSSSTLALAPRAQDVADGTKLAITVTVDSAFTGVKKLIDMNAKYDYTTQTYTDTGSVAMTVDDYKRIVTNWNDNFTVIDNDLYLSTVSADTVYVNSDWAGSQAGAEVGGEGSGKYYGINAFSNMADAAKAAPVGTASTITVSGATEIAAASSFGGGQDVTITGEASFYWGAGWMFVNRGATQGDVTQLAKVTFKDATITRTTHSPNPGDRSIHIGGAEKDSTSKGYGQVDFDNSTVTTEYVVNKNVLNVSNSSELIVTTYLNVAGRPADETPTGEDHTAELNIDSATVDVLGNIKIGNEGRGEINLTNGAELKAGEIIAEKSEINVASSTLTVTGAFSNSGSINVTSGAELSADTINNDGGTITLSGASKLAGTITGAGTLKFDGATINDAITASTNAGVFTGTNKINAALSLKNGTVGGTNTVTADLTFAASYDQGYTVKNDNGSNVTITGGELTAKNYFIGNDKEGVEIDKKDYLIINDGAIRTPAVQDNTALYVRGNGVVQVNGASTIGNEQGNIFNIMDYGKVELTGTAAARTTAYFDGFVVYGVDYDDSTAFSSAVFNATKADIDVTGTLNGSHCNQYTIVDGFTTAVLVGGKSGKGDGTLTLTSSTFTVGTNFAIGFVKDGSVTMSDGSTLSVASGTIGIGLSTGTGLLDVSADSTVTANAITFGDNGSINLTIDASALTETTYKLIDITGDGALDTAKITVNGTDAFVDGATYGDYTLKLWDGDVMLFQTPVVDPTNLYVNAAWTDYHYAQLIDGTTDKYYGINAFQKMEDVTGKILTDGSDTTVHILSNLTPAASLEFQYGDGNVSFVKDGDESVSVAFADTGDFVFATGTDATIMIGEGVTFSTFNNQSDFAFYYGSSLSVYGTISGGANFGALYVYNGDHVVHTTGTIGTGRIHSRLCSMTINGIEVVEGVEKRRYAADVAVADRNADAQVAVNFIFNCSGVFSASDTYITVGNLATGGDGHGVYDTNKGGVQDSGTQSSFTLKNTKLETCLVALSKTDTVFNATDSVIIVTNKFTNAGTVNVSGDSLLTIGTLTGTITVDGDANLTGSSVGGTGNIAIAAGKVLTVGDTTATATSFGAVTNNGEIDIDGALVNLGAITNNGTINMDWHDKLTFSGFTGSAINFDMTGYNGVAENTLVLDYTGAGTMDAAAYKAMISDFTDDEFARTFTVIDNDLFLKAVAAPVVINNDKTIAEAVAEAATSGATTIIVENGTFTAAEFGGEITLNQTFAGTNIVIDGGIFNDARITCGTTVTGLTSKKQYVETAGNRTVTINDGTFNGVLIAGDRIVGETAAGHADHGNDEDGVARDISLTINGGQFNKNVAGGMMLDAKNTTAHVAQYGDVNLTINGGTFVKFVYGGNVSSSKNYSSNTEVYGAITVTLNASAATPISINALYAGSYGTGKVYGSTKVVLTGDGAGLTIADQLWGGCSGDYYTVESDGTKTATSYVLTSDGSKMSTRTLSFEGFSGTLNAKSIKMFSNVAFDADSTVDFSGFNGTLAEVENWDIEFDEDGRLVGSGAFNNDFTGDSLNLAGLSSALENDWVIFDNISRFKNVTEEGAGLAKINGAAAQLSENLLEGELCGYDFSVGDNSFTLAFTEKTEEKAAQMVLRNAVLS